MVVWDLELLSMDLILQTWHIAYYVILTQMISMICRNECTTSRNHLIISINFKIEVQLLKLSLDYMSCARTLAKMSMCLEIECRWMLDAGCEGRLRELLLEKKN